MPMSNIFCSICDMKIDSSSSVNIFSTSFPRQGELLVNFVSRVLRIATFELQDPYICLQCYNLFQMLEQAQKTVLNIRCEILKIYRACERRKNVKRSMYDGTKLNISTNIALEAKRLYNSNDNIEKVLNLQNATQVEDIVQEQCVQDNITMQNISISNTKVKKHLRKETINYNEADSTKSFDYNIYDDIKEGEILKNDIFHNSVALTNSGNTCNINSQGKERLFKSIKINVKLITEIYKNIC